MFKPDANGNDDAEAAQRAADLEELRRQLTRAVDKICPPWLAAQRDDIVQTALVRVSAILERGEGERSLAASYLWKVAYSNTLDEIRRLRRRREQTLVPEIDPEDRSSFANPEQVARGREVGRALLDCLEKLVRPRRLGVMLYLQGHTVPDAARRLGWGLKKMENLVYRGLADLRRCLEGKGLTP